MRNKRVAFNDAIEGMSRKNIFTLYIKVYPTPWGRSSDATPPYAFTKCLIGLKILF